MLPFLMFANRRAGRKSAAQRAFYGPLGERNILGLINQFQPMLMTDTEKKRAYAYDQIHDAFEYLSIHVLSNWNADAMFDLTQNVPHIPHVVKEYILANLDSLQNEAPPEWWEDRQNTYQKFKDIWVSDNPHVQEIWHLIDRLAMDVWRKNNCAASAMEFDPHLLNCLAQLIQSYHLPTYMNKISYTAERIVASIVRLVRSIVNMIARWSTKTDTAPENETDLYSNVSKEAYGWGLIGLSQNVYSLQLVNTVLKPALTLVPKTPKRRPRDGDDDDPSLGSRHKYARLNPQRHQTISHMQNN